MESTRRLSSGALMTSLLVPSPSRARKGPSAGRVCRLLGREPLGSSQAALKYFWELWSFSLKGPRPVFSGRRFRD